MAEKLRTGVVGAGVFGAFHAAKHAASARVELVGVHDLDPARARALADRHNIAAISAFSHLLAAVDAVTIASPAPSHFRLARAALEAGRHVYVEKPLAMSVDEADALIALADRRGLVLQVGHQERFILQALGLPRADAEPKVVEFNRCGPSCGRGEDVSVVFDLMIHDLDIARCFGFAHPRKFDACGDRHETIATISFDNDRRCSFVASRRADARRRLVRIVYDNGEVEIDFIKRRVLDTTPQGSTRARAAEAAFADPLAQSVDAFFASILDGARTMIDGKAGRGAIEWAAAIDAERNALAAAASAGDRMIA